MEVIESPCVLAGKRIRISNDVGDFNILILSSIDSVKRLKGKLDLENDAAEIFVIPQNLDCSSPGHYLIPLYAHDVNISTCLVVNNEDENDERKIKIKLLKQFAHPSAENFKKLLQDAEYWKSNFSDIL